MKLRVESFISVSTSILHQYQHLFYICTYFCPHPTFMMPARGYPRHDVNTRPNPVTWRSMCMWRKLTWTSKPTPTQLRHVHETHVHMNVNTLPNPVTWRSMCMRRKLTWTLRPPPPNPVKNVCFQKRARLLARFSPRWQKLEERNARSKNEPTWHETDTKLRYGGWSKFFYLETAILQEMNFYFCKTFPNSMFIFRGTHVGQQCLLWIPLKS